MKTNKPFDLRIRTAAFAREALDRCRQIPAGTELGAIRCQLFRAATSVGSNSLGRKIREGVERELNLSDSDDRFEVRLLKEWALSRQKKIKGRN